MLIMREIISCEGFEKEFPVVLIVLELDRQATIIKL